MAAMVAILDLQSEQFWLFFFISKSPQCFLPSFKSTGPSVQEKKRKIDFQDGRHCGHLGFLIYFYLQVIPMLPTKFKKSIGLLIQEEKRKINSQDGRHLRFPIGMILAIFNLQVTPMLPTKFRVN